MQYLSVCVSVAGLRVFACVVAVSEREKQRAGGREKEAGVARLTDWL